MKSLSAAEENYLRTIYKLVTEGIEKVSTNEIAAAVNTKAASVSDMLKKLAEKELIDYKKYYGVSLTEEGRKTALFIIRRYRLWEVFLVDKLKFSWDEVNAIAEELEHVKAPLLVRRLDEYLGFPKFDPHGDPIPDEFGELSDKPRITLQEVPVGQSGKIVSVSDTSANFLKYLDKVGIYIGAKVLVLEKIEYDGSQELFIDNQKKVFVSKEVATNIQVMLHPN
ncbi:MAG: metal-dependent transcriptional regulator [Cytophagales bacterium]|uniref:metal-dependent transcriptional regulator n=1 Tax=Cyclobacterium marinum TaxID=104 RepID=UPI0011ECFFDD|nr:metal-dependent transcriptional regulator [Cyclobacterium marinum]MBI0397759.1 metal-dependent transcriptional regulator [Cyclobacterium marinum]MBR9777449.1 metal-dependent transcriptional regulator [Cytophagales bacterium]|tara:strand:- start:29410 stop:30081 length:672 start_codon:yes stop_codon:yes gene_type:complete